MREIEVTSKKYDGSLRDSYRAQLIEETDETIVLYIRPGIKTWDYRKNAQSIDADGIIEIHFKHKWFNVCHICEQISGINLMYINLAMPVTFKVDVLEWTDLDLDYRVHLDNSVELLDEEEFEQNKVLMNYPSDLVNHVRAACQEIEKGLTRRAFPFDYERQVERYQELKNNLLTKN